MSAQRAVFDPGRLGPTLLRNRVVKCGTNEAMSREGLVTDTALRFGFGHLGRFSADYRQALGERPSETLRARTGLGLAFG